MDLLEQLTAWSYHRQGLGRSAPNLLEALRSVVAVYSSHPTAPLALHARSPRFTAEDFFRLERDSKAVRIPGMRTSIFLTTAKASRYVFAISPLSAPQFEQRLRYAEFIKSEYAAFKAAVVELAE